MARYKSRGNHNDVKLLKQVEASKQERRVSGAPPVRPKAYQGVVKDLIDWDTPVRSSGRVRSWKSFRRKQYKS